MTITNVIGHTARSPGTHLAVSSTGASVGSLSGGCVEAAAIREALEAIKAVETSTIRFGTGSPYIDIRLPCGGAMDILIVPNPPIAVLAETISRLERRETVSLQLSRTEPVALGADLESTTGWLGETFRAVHRPDLRLVILGHGAETICLARLAVAFGADVVVISPDDAVVAEAGLLSVNAQPLQRQGRSDHLIGDPFSAAVFLFHDHAWESDLLIQALDQDFLLIGAMGSQATHKRRIENLRLQGVGQEKLASILGPIGLIPGARDPQTLALSILSQVVAHYEERCASKASHPAKTHQLEVKEPLPNATAPVRVKQRHFEHAER
ncbi:XdhC family protein [Acidisoma silvae]|uniref:XdhC family protein n=2 Tax=Acidisoma silvae TaxID=2802396 RepID=A0A963YWH5_9PROT|nr:XdhC family protein [Acidisoma silvae]